MGPSLEPEAKMAHVNLMTDTIIANLPEEGLRSVLRSMLATDPSITKNLEQRTKVYLTTQSATPNGDLFTQDGTTPAVTPLFLAQQGRIRAMMGCGMCYESIPLLAAIVVQTKNLAISTIDSPEVQQALTAVDGDIIQALTAVQKTLVTSSGLRPLEGSEHLIISSLHQALLEGQQSPSRCGTYAFDRSLVALQASGLLSEAKHNREREPPEEGCITISALPETVETFKLNGKSLPRLFCGLWQLSSPSWGCAPVTRIRSQFAQYASQGFTAYDMADHYGDAEIIFGNFRASCHDPEALFGATKYCIFTPTTITRQVVQANITERCQRMSASHIDLLQFHWQDYNDPQYITALQYLQEDPRVRSLGLCNFDTSHMLEIISNGTVKIATNQVQFSLIDSRPLSRMAQVCETHHIKLLTYGTLLGGFLSEKWLDEPEPELFSSTITPSQRKYYEMILNWGSWALFQELLHTLKDIASKHGVSLSNVATRWVLDFEFVGAVIVGTRWGISDNAEDNLRVYGLHLDEEDRERIESVLRRSRRDVMVALLGDCGGEYR